MSLTTQLMIRALLLGMGAAALYWTVSFEPFFRIEAPLNDAASKILSGEKISDTSIEALKPRIDVLQNASRCFVRGLQSGIILELQLIQDSIGAADHAKLDTLVPSTARLIGRALECAPVSSYSWLALFWVDNLRLGFSDQSIRYLEMSYMTGPREGWISLKRNAFALAVYDGLPEDLQDKVVSEFSDLVQAGFIDDAANILTGPGRSQQARLVSGLSNVNPSLKKDLALALRRRGFEISVPGVNLSDPRPWDR